MAKRIAQTVLNASTIDILNVIRQNASYEYQDSVPEVVTAADIPKVGEVLYGSPALANQFINALVNRIAIVSLQSANFNNPYKRVKKGYLEYGETIEDIFVNIAKVITYSPEKGEEREYKRTLPDVRSAFHVINWRVLYPVTIQDNDLMLAFTSADGVQNLIAKIVDSVYQAAEYDEFLLTKYLLIKAVSHGHMYPVAVTGDSYADAAAQYRGYANLLQFMGDKFNDSAVLTTTPKDRQLIFMDSMYNAQFDVNVLASAFNMDKATFLSSLMLIDNWDSFDNDRFEAIRAQSDGLEEVTADELAIMSSVKAILVDENWFQMYDNNNKFTEKYCASGLYWNYFYHTWKTVSSSPFANAIVFVGESTAYPDSVSYTVSSVDVSDVATVLTLSLDADTPTIDYSNYNFVQTEEMTAAGVAVQKYGAVIIPATATGSYTLEIENKATGKTYKASATVSSATTSGTALTFTVSE